MLARAPRLSLPRFRHLPRRRIRIRWIRFASCRGIVRLRTRCTTWRRRGSSDSSPAVERPLWLAYLARSREQYARDTASMGRELRAAGKTRMTRAPYAHGFELGPDDDAAMVRYGQRARSGRRHPEFPGAERRVVEAR